MRRHFIKIPKKSTFVAIHWRHSRLQPIGVHDAIAAIFGWTREVWRVTIPHLCAVVGAKQIYVPSRYYPLNLDTLDDGQKVDVEGLVTNVLLLLSRRKAEYEVQAMPYVYHVLEAYVRLLRAARGKPRVAPAFVEFTVSA